MLLHGYRLCGTILLLALCLSRPAAASPSGDASADSLRLPSPRGALIRSLILPGWGQLYNRKPGKAVLCAAVSAVCLAEAVAAQQALDEADLLQREDRAARRNTRFLFLALSITFSALDAYVDAHLAGFENAECVRLDTGPDRIVLRLSAVW